MDRDYLRRQEGQQPVMLVEPEKELSDELLRQIKVNTAPNMLPPPSIKEIYHTAQGKHND